MSSNRLFYFCLTAIAGLIVGAAGSHTTLAAFSDVTSNPGNTFEAAADFGGSGVTLIKDIGAASCGNSSNSLSVPAGGIAAGNTIIARLAHRSTNPGMVTISDSKRNVWTKDADVHQGAVRIVIFSAFVTTAMAQNDQVTVTFPAQGDAVGLRVEEYSGISATNRVDVVGSATGDSATPSVSATTTNASNFLFGAVASTGNRTYSEGAGWSSANHQVISCGGAINRADNHGAYRPTTSVGTYTYAPTLNIGERWAATLVAYRAAYGPPSCARPALAYMSGYEYGALGSMQGNLDDGLGTTGGFPVVDSVVKRSGDHSLKIAKTNTGANFALKNISSGTVTTRVALRLDSLPTSNVQQIRTVLPAAGSAANLGYDAAQKRFTMRFGSAAASLSSTVVEAGRWYVIESRVSMATNPRTAAWRIDGVDQTQATSTEGASTVTGVRAGSAVTSDVYTAHFDDVVLSGSGADYPMGDGHILALRPNSMGTHSNPTHFDTDTNSGIGPSSYLRLDDTTMDSTADFVKQITAGSGSYVAMGFANPAETCIRGVSAVVAFNSESGTGGTNSGKTSIFDGTAERVLHSGDMSSPTLTYMGRIVNPAASYWTQATVAGLTARIGYSSDNGPVPQWQALLLEYETPA